MSGGNWERVAAYVNNGNSNLTTNGGDLVKEGTADRYRNVYAKGSTDGYAENYAVSTPAKGHYGDAVWETSGKTGDPWTDSWYSDYSYFLYSTYPFFGRGGSYGSESSAGVFYFNRYTGGVDIYNGFRVVVPAL